MNQRDHQADYRALAGSVQVSRRFRKKNCQVLVALYAKPKVLYNLVVPEISRFLGIVITMFYRDHGPPHFHASYGEYAATVSIREFIVTGRFPKRALSLVTEWCELHEKELLENWELARERKPLKRIAPLE
jgi:hypothetical protein